MNVNIDLITPLPTGDQQRRAQALRVGRKERQARDAEVRRTQLLEVAWELLKVQGMAGFNMRELGLRAGYTAGALYSYFASRDHLLQALRERLVDEVGLAVARVRSPRRVQRPAPATANSPLDADRAEAANARQRFLVRSEVWWRKLTQEPFAIPLLLLSGPVLAPNAVAEGATEAGAASWTPLEALERATQSCVDDLEMAGWASSAAKRLHREALFLGVGLATLGAGPDPQVESEVAPPGFGCFRASLERWLANGGGQVAVQADAAGSGQHDLFSG